MQLQLPYLAKASWTIVAYHSQHGSVVNTTSYFMKGAFMIVCDDEDVKNNAISDSNFYGVLHSLSVIALKNSLFN